MATSPTLAACILLAAQTYQLPPAVLVGIYAVERGQVGRESGPNGNGSYDLGPMQINTVWLPEIARHWGMEEREVRRWIRDDGCVNVTVAAWILQRQMARTGQIWGAVARYHSATPEIGRRYLDRVTAAMRRLGLLKG